MTASNTPDQRIDVILETLSTEIALRHTATNAKGVGYQRRRNADDIDVQAAKQSLKSLFETMMAEVVGEKVDIGAAVGMFDTGAEIDAYADGRNLLRTEQRQRIPQVISKYFGEEK